MSHGEQLAFFLFAEADISSSEDEISASELFAPDGRRRCAHCRQRLTAFGGRLYCMRPGCSGGAS